LLPRHLAIIMDGNGRWAKARGKPRIFGHVKGARVAKKIITECSDLGIKYLTLYAFSTENWLRPEAEVNFLMRLLRRYLKKETDNLVKKNIKFTTIGDLSRLPAEIVEQINVTVSKTSINNGLNLVFAINYGSRQEIVEAAKSIITKIANDEMDFDQVDEHSISKNLYTKNFPDPDLIIRTSGESRLSNFLMWQAAYSEFYFTDILWPDFGKDDLHAAISDFKQRNRRFGAITNNENHPN
jgi:undecaprenyl diphosphate synthase